jgi:hypothetical protein
MLQEYQHLKLEIVKTQAFVAFDVAFSECFYLDAAILV